jgi:hypothetical protein
MPVAIVVIFWKILPGDENERAFFEHWERTLELEDRSGLVGEFLSQPLTKAEVGFDCSALGLDASDDYVPFFNVGIWDSVEAFREHVIERLVNPGPGKEDFEYAPRARMILSPKRWRVGDAQLPNGDQLSSG